MEEPTQRIAGSVERIIAHSEDTGWAVLEISEGNRLITVVGSLAHVDEGLRIEAEGYWSDHAKFGRQFKATSARVYAPVGRAGIERFLRSGAVEGIGPVFAKKIVEKFGDDTLTVIERERWRLKYLKGVGPKRIDAIVSGVRDYRTRMEIMSFLHGRLGPIRAQRVYDKYKDQAREMIAENPYRLIEDFEGIGFALADQVARDVGVDPDHPMRRRAAIITALKQATAHGHTCLPIDNCHKRVAELLDSDELATQALSEGTEDVQWQRIERRGEPCIELRKFEFLDKRVAERLERIAQTRWRHPEIDPTKAIPWAEQQSGLVLEDGQGRAVAAALKAKVTCITGGPGVGKTTILDTLIRILKAKRYQVSLAAPTGRAARRMTESIGEPADTIHKLLEYSPRVGGFTRKRGNPLETDAVVIDETSMVDIGLARSLLEAVPDDAKVVFVGDRDQLPSVGPGQFLADLIGSGTVPVASLTKPFRQAADSPIIRNAHKVNRGEVPDLYNESEAFEFIETAKAADTAHAIIDVASQVLPAAGYNVNDDVLVLVPINRGTVGVHNVNAALQARINPTPKDSIRRGDRRFGLNDKIIQMRNDRDLQVSNGDIGVIEGIDHDKKQLHIRFDQHVVDYPFERMSALSLAYCISVHRSQGAEADCVVVAMDRSGSVLLNRKLLYTAITRARKKVVLIGQRNAVHIAVSEARADERMTMLRERLVSKSKVSKLSEAAVAIN